MPLTSEQIGQIGSLQESGLSFTGNWRIDRANLIHRGYRFDEADQLARRYASVKTGDAIGMGDVLMAPITAVGEVFQTLQKPIIGFSAALAQGQGFGAAIEEAIKAPFTTGRSFSEIPGMPEWAGLALDIVADPAWLIGGPVKLVGQSGKAYRKLQGAFLDLYAGKIWSKEGRMITSMQEALYGARDVKHLGISGGKIDDWRNSARAAYKEVASAFERAGMKRPSIDEIVVGAKGKTVQPDQLMKAGVMSMASIGVGSKRWAPLPGAQAAAARAFDTPMMRKMKITWLLGLDKDVDLARRGAGVYLSASSGRQALSAEAAKRFQEQLQVIAERSGVDLNDLDQEKLIHFIEARGLLGSGSRKAWDTGNTNLDDLSATANALRELVSSPAAFSQVFSGLGQGEILGRVKGVFRESYYKSALSGMAKPGEAVTRSMRARAGHAATRRAKKLAEVLGVMVAKDADIAARHGLGEMTDMAALKVIEINPSRVEVDPFILESVTPAGRKRVYERSLEIHGDAAKAEAAVVEQVEESISVMVEAAFGLKEGDPFLEVANAYEEFFRRVGLEEKAAGLISSLKKGYIPRRATPHTRRLINKAWRESGEGGLLSRRQLTQARGELVPKGQFQAERGLGDLTILEIEDSARRGMLEVTGRKKHAEEWFRFKERLDAEGPMKWVSRMMGRFGKDDFLRRIAGADEEMMRFFWSDPMTVASARWAEFSKAINARDFVDQSVRLFAVSRVTKKKTEKVREFLRRIKDETDSLARPSDYRVYIDRTALPKSIREQLAAAPDDAVAITGTSLVEVKRDLIEMIKTGPKDAMKSVEAHIIHKDYSSEILARQERFRNPALQFQFMRNFASLTSLWKQWALFPRPAYHFRNFISNSWLMVMAGMSPFDLPAYYYKATKLLGAMRGSKKMFGMEEKVFTRGRAASITSKAAAREKILEEVALTAADGTRYTYGQLALNSLNDGILDTGQMTADIGRTLINEMAKSGQLKVKLGAGSIADFARYDTKLQHMSQQGARFIEGTGRLALYMWELEKNASSPTLAASSVFKHLFNYNDMRPGEHMIRQLAIPFWAWMRNNVPLQMRALIKDPARTLTPLQIAHNLRKRMPISEDLEPDWIATELGFPLRRTKGVRGEDRIEFGFMGSYFPTTDLMRLGVAAAGMITRGLEISFASKLPENMRVRLEGWKQRDQHMVALRTLIQNLNPLAIKPIELASGFSLYRMREINPVGSGDLVEIPWLGGYITSPETAFLFASMPLLSELDRAFRGADVIGREIPAGERVSRYLTGMPRVGRDFRDPGALVGFGGRYDIDPRLARDRMIRKAKTAESVVKRTIRQKSRFGTLTEEQRRSLMDRLGMLQKRTREVRRGARIR